MKKLVMFGMALATAMCFTLSAATLTGCVSQDKKESVEKKEKKGDFKRSHASRHDKGFKAVNPFEGIELTEKQKSELAELRSKKVERTAPKDAPCCKSDTAKCCQGKGEACCRKVTPEQKKQLAQERLNKIKSILTPEQYQKYLENIALSQMNPQHKPGRRGPRNGQGAQKK